MLIKLIENGKLNVGVLQFNPIFGEIRKNVDFICEKLKGIKADLMVLPELCTTGYQFTSRDELESLSEELTKSYAVSRLLEVSKTNGMCVVFGMAQSLCGRFYNAGICLCPDGTQTVYHKIHLFFEEKLIFDPGDGEYPVIDWQGTRIGIMICFDWAFPEAARILALKGADVICHPANLVLPFCQSAMITRSIENHVFTVTANRIGREERGGKQALVFGGQSQVIDPRGGLLFRLGEEEEVRVVSINTAQARNKYITPHNNLFEDRRPFFYKRLSEQ